MEAAVALASHVASIHKTATRNRLNVSLSDLGGYDPTIYEGTLKGLFRAVTDAFDVGDIPVPDERDIMRIYHRLRLARRTIGGDVFRRAAFRQLVLAARLAVSEVMRTKRSSR